MSFLTAMSTLLSGKVNQDTSHADESAELKKEGGFNQRYNPQQNARLSAEAIAKIKDEAEAADKVNRELSYDELMELIRSCN